MVSLENIREDMKLFLDRDNKMHNVDVNADSVDEALADASVQLDTKTANLEYEVVEKGSDGFLGIGKKPWKLRIYQNPTTLNLSKKSVNDDLFGDESEIEEQHIINSDGLYYIRHFGSQIMIKILLPSGNGKPVDEREILQHLKRPDTITIEEDLVQKYIKQGTEKEYQPVGEYKHVSAGDAVISIDISKDEMKATITATAPAMSGADVSVSMIERTLKAQGVTTGIEDDKISEFVDNPVYNVPYEIAAGIPPVDGRDAYIAYDFETDPTKLHAKESANGQVDFKELNLIQNVIKGGRLAQKIPAERGKGGKTLFGRYLEAKNGKDIPIPLGQNVRLDSDGVTVIAEEDGQVMLVAGKITVEPLLQLDGVNIKTGNIKFLGTVMVKGNVEDGFNVDASGNIEVSGTVGRCIINAGGDIIVQQGVFGKDEGCLISKKSLWAKFIQAAKVEVEDSVIVTDSIMNSEITAMKNIILNGKKAQITGGHLFATEEIAAKNIGSPGGGAETILEVGFDPRAKQRLDELQDKQGNLVKELENVDLDISTLENQKKIRRILPKDKEENLNKLKERRDQISTESGEMSTEIEKLQKHLRELKVVGKVKASGTVYAGVKIYVRDVLDEVHNEVTSVTFYYENSFVKRGKYEPPAAEIKAPDGYSTN
ncbi:MAG: FapA family protein [Treponema sp.]|nr:FapA family protein [Treponema sp.]